MGALESVCAGGREDEAEDDGDGNTKAVRAAEAGAVASLLTQDIQQQRVEEEAGGDPGGGADGEAARARIRQALEEGLSPLMRLPPGTRAVAQMDSLVWRSRRRDAVLGDFPQMDYEGVMRPLLRHYPARTTT